MLIVTQGALVDPPVVDTPGGRRHHVAKPLRIEPGAAQHRCHELVIEQLFEARLIAAAFVASGHGPLLTCEIARTIAAKHGLFVTRGGIFRGDLSINSPKFACEWNWRRDKPSPLLGWRGAA